MLKHEINVFCVILNFLFITKHLNIIQNKYKVSVNDSFLYICIQTNIHK